MTNARAAASMSPRRSQTLEASQYSSNVKGLRLMVLDNSPSPRSNWSIKTPPRSQVRAGLFSFGALVTRLHPRLNRPRFDRNQQPTDCFQKGEGPKLPALRPQHAKPKGVGGVTIFGSNRTKGASGRITVGRELTNSSGMTPRAGLPGATRPWPRHGGASSSLPLDS